MTICKFDWPESGYRWYPHQSETSATATAFLITAEYRSHRVRLIDVLMMPKPRVGKRNADEPSTSNRELSVRITFPRTVAMFSCI